MISLTEHAFSNKLDAFYDELARKLALFLIVAGLGLAWGMLPRAVYPYELLPFLGALILVGGLGLGLLNRERMHLARYWLVLGCLALLLIAMLSISSPWMPYFGIPLVLAAAILLSNIFSLLFALVILIVSAVLNELGLRAYAMDALIVLMVACQVVNWLTVTTITTTVEWYQSMQRQSLALLHETREHRAELARVLKSLKLANDLLRRTQNELVVAKKQAETARQMKEQFAANISHELRTPLNLILGFSKIMYLSPEVYGNMQWEPELRNDIYQVYRSSRHLSELIDDILDLSQFEMTGFSLNREVTAMSPFLLDTASTLTNLFRSSPVKLIVSIGEDLPDAEIDRTRIRQALINLTTNAYRYTTEGTVEISAQQAAGEIQIAVRDTGIGIPEDKLPFLFDAFYQADSSLHRKNGGVGLGLTITQRFVEAHGGQISVESQEGFGSTFTIHLPVVKSSVPVVSDGQESIPYRQLQPCLLLVDADPLLFNTLRRQVNQYDWVQVTGPEGLREAIRERQPRAVIVNRPTDGSALPEIEQSLGNSLTEVNLPVISCSFQPQGRLKWEMPLVSFLSKPIDAQALESEIEQIGQINRLLVIDDDRGFTRLVERTIQLSDPNITVEYAYDGEEGLERMRSQPPDLVLLDIFMPGKSGLEVIEDMRHDTQLCQIPVVLLSSGTYELDRVTQQNARFSVERRGGMRTSEMLRYLRAIAGELDPNTNGL